jgi:hypothetical protein
VIIGIDFDNTIASYDEVMYRLAVEWGWIDARLPRNKRLVRNALRALPEGELKWRRLQTHCYGPGMREATPMEGVGTFFAKCRERGVPVRIVSHKTEYANFGDPSVNLRAAALDWMKQQDFFGVPRDQVFFEDTRAQKIERIRVLGITHFVDDLEETFLEESFPPQVAKILYAPQPVHKSNGEWRSFGSWAEIGRHLLG